MAINKLCRMCFNTLFLVIISLESVVLGMCLSLAPAESSPPCFQSNNHSRDDACSSWFNKKAVVGTDAASVLLGSALVDACADGADPVEDVLDVGVEVGLEVLLDLLVGARHLVGRAGARHQPLAEFLGGGQQLGLVLGRLAEHGDDLERRQRGLIRSRNKVNVGSRGNRLGIL